MSLISSKGQGMDARSRLAQSTKKSPRNKIKAAANGPCGDQLRDVGTSSPKEGRPFVPPISSFPQDKFNDAPRSETPRSCEQIDSARTTGSQGWRGELGQLLESLRRQQELRQREQEQRIMQFFDKLAAPDKLLRSHDGYRSPRHPDRPLAEVDVVELAAANTKAQSPASLSPRESSDYSVTSPRDPELIREVPEPSAEESCRDIGFKFLSQNDSKATGNMSSRKFAPSTTMSKGDVMKMIEATGGAWLLRPFIASCIEFQTWFSKVSEEPKRKGPFASIVDGFLFETICFLVVIANGFFIVVVTNWQMTHLDQHLPTEMQMFEFLFLMYYWLELAVKLSVHRMYFFVGRDMGFNVFDCFVVGLATLEMAAERIQGSQPRNRTYLRLVRLLKMVRVLRVARGLRFIAEIRLVLDMLVLSFGSLIRCIILLFFILGVFAILFVQESRDYLTSMDQQELQYMGASLMLRFGSVQTGVVTLLKAITGGEDWSAQLTLFEAQNSMSQYLYLFFIAFFSIAFWNIVTGQFMQQTLKLAAPDMEELLFQKRKQDMSDKAALMQMVSTVDNDKDQHLSYAEFQKLMENTEFRNYFDLRGIDIKDTEIFFKMLTVSAGVDESKVDIEHFVWACLRMKGVATSIDLHSMDFEMRMMHKRINKFTHRTMLLLEEIAQNIKAQSPRGNDKSRSAKDAARGGHRSGFSL